VFESPKQRTVRIRDARIVLVAELVIDRRFRGPDDSGNGGYTCGRIAAYVDGAAEVTLRLPPPLEVPLRVDGGRVLDGEALVAEFGSATVALDVPEPPTWEEAIEAQRPDVDSPFPHCFVCGYRRAQDDGLHIHAGPWRDGVVAGVWVPRADTVGEEFVWAALDCPGAYAVMAAGRGIVVLGRLAARVLRVPEAGEHCVVVGWPLGSDGRKHEAGTAVYAGGEAVAVARAVWIEPRPTAGA
jgi:hypothetical protein